MIIHLSSAGVRHRSRQRLKCGSSEWRERSREHFGDGQDVDRQGDPLHHGGRNLKEETSGAGEGSNLPRLRPSKSGVLATIPLDPISGLCSTHLNVPQFLSNFSPPTSAASLRVGSLRCLIFSFSKLCESTITCCIAERATPTESPKSQLWIFKTS